MSSDGSSRTALIVLQELLAEAGAAVADQTRALSPSAVPETVRSALANLGATLSIRPDLDDWSTRGGAAVEAIRSGMASAGQAGAAGLQRGWSWLGDQASLIAQAGREVLPGARSAEAAGAELLLQEALRKHDALIRELQDRNAASGERLAYLNDLLVRLEEAMGGLVVGAAPDGPDGLAVLAAQRQRLDAEQRGAARLTAATDDAIGRASALLSGLSAEPQSGRGGAAPPAVRSWDEIVAEARADCADRPVSFDDLLTLDEQQGALARVDGWDSEFADLHRLAPADYAVAGVAGVLAALADILLVQVPRHPGFLGSEGSEGGWLSNLLKDGFAELLPPETVRSLERTYPVPYDAPTSAGLALAVKGLGPRTHRLHALGHDPLLGWLFGVRDVLAGGFTAIGADGAIVIQDAPGWDAVDAGRGLFAGIADAFATVAGHMLSDVATPAGLPPPLFGACQLLQQRLVGDASIAEITREMYRSGYDLRHVLAGGVCTMVVEVVVRLSCLARDLHEGRSLAEALPVGSQPRLRSMLVLAHGVAAAINAGKVAVTGSPLAVNYVQWLAFFRYLVPQLRWLLVGRARERDAFLRARLDAGWLGLDKDLGATWRRSFGTAPTARL